MYLDSEPGPGQAQFLEGDRIFPLGPKTTCLQDADYQGKGPGVRQGLPFISFPLTSRAWQWEAAGDSVSTLEPPATPLGLASQL